MVYIENNIKPCVLMVCDMTVSAGLSVLAFLEALNSCLWHGSCPHLSFIPLVSPVVIVIEWSCREQLMEWALCLPWLYCSRGTQWYSWETVLCPNLARNIYSGPEMSVYSHRKQRYCVGGCCSPQLHKIPVFVGIDWNSLVLASAALQGKEGWQVCDSPAALALSPAVTSVHRAPSLGWGHKWCWPLLPWACSPLSSGQADLPGSFPCIQRSNGGLELIHFFKKGKFTSTGCLRSAIAASSLGDPQTLGNLPKPSKLKLFWLMPVPLWGCFHAETAPTPATLKVCLLCRRMVTSGEGHSLWKCCDGKVKGGAGLGWLQDRAMVGVEQGVTAGSELGLPEQQLQDQCSAHFSSECSTSPTSAAVLWTWPAVLLSP